MYMYNTVGSHTTENLSGLDFDLTGSLKVNCDDVVHTIYGFLLMINSNMKRNSAPLRDIRLWNLSDLECDLSRTLKVKVMMSLDSSSPYSFLLMVNSNIGPNSAPLWDIRLWNLRDFDLSRALKVKCCGVIGLAIFGFLLMVNSNIWPKLAALRDIRLRNLGDLDCDLSRSCVMVSLVSPYIIGFLLMFNSNIGPN